MPKNSIDYSNTIIYKICCNDESVTDIYVGHTTNFVKRKYQHKILCNSNKKLKIYDIIRQNGGWDNWNMVEIAKYNCQDATEARIREQEHYELLKPNLNSVNPVTNNEYQILSIDNSLNMEKNIQSKHINNKKYYCTYCLYNTSKQSDYAKHINTSKHKKNIHDIEKKVAENLQYICKYCQKIYTARNSLWYHEKKCTHKVSTLLESKNETIEKQDITELVKYLIKENSELKNMISQQNIVLNKIEI